MYKVIIVDDEKLLRQGFIHMTDWTQSGFEIVGDAANGVEALALVESLHPDIVVTDIRMPVMDGIELTRILKQSYPNIQVIVLSSYNDFDYVKDTLQLGALDYILKPKMQYTDLVNAMDKAKLTNLQQSPPISPNKPSQSMLSFLKSLLAQPIECSVALQNKLDDFNISLQSSHLRLILVQIEYEEGDSILDDSPVNQISQTIVDDLQSKFRGGENGCCFAVNPEQVLILHNHSDPENLEWMTTILTSYEVQYWLCVSEIFSGFEEIHSVYQQLLAISNFRFYMPSGAFLQGSDYRERSTRLDLQFKLLNDFIDKQNFQGLYAHIDAVVQESMLQQRYVDPYAMRNGFIEVLYYVIHRLDEKAFDIEVLHKQKLAFFKNIENSRHLDECLAMSHHILMEIENQLKHKRNAQISPTIQAILDYIQQNFSEDISLQSIAHQFHLNKSYLSQLFKVQTGENFNNYLANLRINEAKAMLRESNPNIYTVCQAIGYPNPSYFGQVFKKIVGMKPSEYSKLYHK
ncbi:response regulator [Paenibacillus alba]|uniref:Response regulator n=1 Tax=Paenibacillus alba TaxID=1197127 RepID=A0ABU6G939_9BACL|nr:response regulator [Paenibacillus alba]MEC0230461.1 response regulator [Paenibacillus alba]